MTIIPVENAVGHVLAHDITRIIKDVEKGPVFKKGHIITQEDIPVLLSVGKKNIYIYEKGLEGSARKTFKEVFELLQEENLLCVKSASDLESKKSTVKRNRADFRRFITGTSLEYEDGAFFHDAICL